jgi:hypothetical protein
MAENFVLIGCKIPNGIILELITEPSKDVKEQTLQPRPTGPRVTLKGSNTLRTDRRMAQAQHLYATTRVEAAFWNAWYARNRDMDFVKNGLVFVAKNESELKGISKERQGVATGLEPLNPDLSKESRIPKGAQPSTRVETDPGTLAIARQNEQSAAEAAAAAAGI